MTDLTPEQRASLEAVTKKAAERASQSLSKLIGIPVLLEMCRVRMVEMETLLSILATPEASVTAAILPIIGDGVGSSALISTFQDANLLVDLVTKTPHGSTKEHDDVAISVLKETGNIIGGAFLSALSDAVGFSLIQSVPELVTGKLRSVIETVVSRLDHMSKEEAVAFEIDFELRTTTTTKAIIVHYVFLMKSDTAKKFLLAIPAHSHGQ